MHCAFDTLDRLARTVSRPRYISCIDAKCSGLDYFLQLIYRLHYSTIRFLNLNEKKIRRTASTAKAQVNQTRESCFPPALFKPEQDDIIGTVSD
ncbi:uncharacterized protein PHALS_14040 [Plasmopara halstedii]|uniref:Uncharacterized protein n=1 Tax=Plasmopara halstedii TaxID=4781 RepID=A0A0P1AQH7_PLAHL|nr:uncharacterized protein PHALS_14040 [Plasmopara halstedii]CEG43748.1 hypothetical protein PHALS_14040 [Plasmopara halstedii]|eukprot:XP_024580117.1 hypothetical protein PHALS_14040 [Plasmopara halstedii]